MNVWPLQPLGVLVHREEVRQLVAEDGHAARLEPDDGHARLDLGPQRVEDLAQQSLGRVEHAEVVERPAAAERRPRDDHVEAGVLEHLDGRLGGLRVEVVVERVGPEDHRRPPAVARRPPAPNQALNVSGANAGIFRCVAIPPSTWMSLPTTGQSRDEVHQPRHQRREPRPPVDQAHRVGVPRAAAGPRSSARGTRPCRSPCRRSPGTRSCSPCRPGRGRAPRGPARLRQPSFIGSPWSISKSRWARPRVECISSLRDHVARAHRPALLLAALADADAALGRVGEAAVVVGELEVRLDLRRVVVRAQPQVLARQVGVDHLGGFILLSGSQIALNSPKARTSSGAEHLGQQRGLATGRRRARPRASRRSETTRSAASSRNARKCSTPVVRSSGRSRSACGCSPGRSGRRARSCSRTSRSSLRRSRR